MTVSTPRPPHGLQLVIDFVNTLDVERGEDGLDGPLALSEWLAEHRLLELSEDAPPETAHATQLREALRSVMLAHNGGNEDSNAVAVLEDVARRGELSVAFCPDGSVGLRARSGGLDGALAELLVPIARSAADGSWKRVKACRADDCHWAFYDHSRNRSGRWCDMAVCGNRTKVRAYRSKRASA